MRPGDLKLVLTCHACPEQYDIYDVSLKGRGEYVGYIRYRWGYLALHPVTKGQVDWNIEVWSWSCNSGLSGILPLEERDQILNTCKEELSKWWNKRYCLE